MRLVDTHCHLDFKDYDKDRDKVIKHAVSGGISRIIVPGIDLESSSKAVSLAEKYEPVYAACGVHPHEADKTDTETLEELKKLCSSSRKVVAVGEVGLDYYRNLSSKENQMRLLEGCIGVAKETALPLIFHNRGADGDFLELLKRHDADALKGVFHCFSGSEDFLKEILCMGFYVSFTGSITFGKADELRRIASMVPPEKLMLETDSPYMSPEPVRGMRNEPANVRHLVDVYTRLYKLAPGDVARITTHNANHLFGLGLGEESRIAYPIRNSLYLNITNKCTNECVFCTRNISEYVKGHNLMLDHEPREEEILAELKDIKQYDEIVFCGFGEPTTRLDVIRKVAAFVKKNGKRVRLVTNGHGDLINKTNVPKELKGLVDIVSVSLNAPDKESYTKICKPLLGEASFDSILSFIRECLSEGIEVEITCLDFIGEEGVKKCEKMAGELGVRFRLRKLNVVG